MALTFDDVIISYDILVFNKAGIKLQGKQSKRPKLSMKINFYILRNRSHIWWRHNLLWSHCFQQSWYQITRSINQSINLQCLTMIVQCLKNASIFVTSHGQTLIYLFQTENSASFECVMPHFHQNPKNLKIRGSLLPYDQ